MNRLRHDDIRQVSQVRALSPRQERFVDMTVEIIWTASWVGLLILGFIALSQKRFK